MQKLMLVLAALGIAGTAGIVTVLFCAGIYAEGSCGGSWKTWTSAEDRKEGGVTAWQRKDV